MRHLYVKILDTKMYFSYFARNQQLNVKQLCWFTAHFLNSKFAIILQNVYIVRVNSVFPLCPNMIKLELKNAKFDVVPEEEAQLQYMPAAIASNTPANISTFFNNYTEEVDGSKSRLWNKCGLFFALFLLKWASVKRINPKPIKVPKSTPTYKSISLFQNWATLFAATRLMDANLLFRNHFTASCFKKWTDRWRKMPNERLRSTECSRILPTGTTTRNHPKMISSDRPFNGTILPML